MKKKIENIFSYRFLLRELVVKGIKLKYRDSYLGILWTMLEPLLTTAVLTIVFGSLYGRSPEFPLYVLTGRMFYGFFSHGTKGALKSIRGNSSMFKKVYVEKQLYPLSVILSNYITFLISLIVMFPLGIYCGIYPSLRWLGIIFPLLVLLLLTYGVGMILATMAVYFKDMEYLWEVVSMIIMYTCAIFYKVDRLAKTGTDWILKWNPVYGIIVNTRAFILGESFEPQLMCYSLGVAVLTTIIGVVWFKKKQDEFILYI